MDMAKVARLLERIVPERYQLSLDVDMEKQRFRGLEEIKFELDQASHELVFHAVGLDVTIAKLDEDTKAGGIHVNAEDQTVTFEFAHKVSAGAHTLSVSFTGHIQDSLHGFYRSTYTHDGHAKSLAITQFEAVHAREAFVCVDEPSAKAVFEVSLTVPDALTALSNTNITSEQPAGSGLKRVQFAPSPKMSTYLLAWVVGELEYVEATTKDAVEVRVYAVPGNSHQVAFPLETGVRTLEFYNEYFGIPYPLPKLDMIAVPDFAAGAMENWGLVTYRETALLLDPAKTSLGHKQRVAEVITHELAHQWFGNLVTMQWWEDLWLNEGFASWMEVFAEDKLFPDWQLWTEFASSNLSYAMDLDSLASTHPIQVEVDDPRGLDEIFDAVSYAKGASIINMLHHYIGDDAFRQGLQNYLKKFSHRNATTHDLWQALGEASGKPVDKVMSAWTIRPGYPYLSYEDGRLQQQRFFSSPTQAAKAKLTPSDVWPVPWDARVAGDQEVEPVLLEQDAGDLPEAVVQSEWFKPNPGQTGFYRSLYTEPMIKALAEPLAKKTLPAVDRYGVVSDVVATTEAGLTDSTVALEMIAALREETDYVVWGGVTGGLGSIEAVVEDEPLRDQIDRFGHWLVQPNAARLGWEIQEGEPVFDTLMRPLVLQQAVRFDDEDITRQSRKLFKQYLEGQAISPDLRPVLLYAAARHGETDEFEAILDRYRQEQSPQVKISYLSALGRFRKPKLIDRFLELGLSDDVRPQDIYIIIAWAFRNREARHKAWTWMKDNWDEWIRRYGAGGHMLERFPLYASSGFATHDMAHEIGEFFDGHPHPATKRPTQQAVEAVELKADWYDRDKLKIQNFMDTWSKDHQ
jgi:puromycin-sensitive aminopeptidase